MDENTIVENISTELVVKTAVTPGTINCNFQEMKATVAFIKNTYINMVYDEDPDKLAESFVLMKKDRTKLSKGKDLLDNERKENKKKYLKPLDDYENEIKSLINDLDEARDVIDKKVKAFEEAARNTKREAIRKFFDSMATNIPEDYREKFYQKIYNSSWENVSSTKKAYVDSITESVQKYEAGMETLKGFTKYQEDGIKIFKETLDINASIAKINEQVKREEEIIAREKDRIEAEVKRKAEAEVAAAKEAIRLEERAKAKAEEQTKVVEAVQSTMNFSDNVAHYQNSASTTKPVVSNPNPKKVIGIRILAGAVMEVFCPDDSYKVVILDEDTADNEEKMDFFSEMSDSKNIY